MRERILAVLPVVIAHLLLLAVLLVAAEYLLPVRVVGSSMEPALFSGDLVLVQRGGDVGPGDVALSQPPAQGAVLHRVVAFDEAGSLRLRGDANDIEDLKPVKRTHIGGRAVAVLPVGRLLHRWRVE